MLEMEKKQFNDDCDFRAKVKLKAGKWLIDGVPVTASAAELNGSDAGIVTGSFVIGAEAVNVINVGIQLKDGDGNDVAVRGSLAFYLSSDASGDTIEASGPDSWVIGTDGILLPDGSDSLISGRVVSEVDGDIDIDMTHVGADTFYMNLVMPSGKIVTSEAITFDAAT